LNDFHKQPSREQIYRCKMLEISPAETASATRKRIEERTKEIVRNLLQQEGIKPGCILERWDVKNPKKIHRCVLLEILDEVHKYRVRDVLTGAYVSRWYSRILPHAPPFLLCRGAYTPPDGWIHQFAVECDPSPEGFISRLRTDTLFRYLHRYLRIEERFVHPEFGEFWNLERVNELREEYIRQARRHRVSPGAPHSS
jgi:hypothetical protein